MANLWGRPSYANVERYSPCPRQVPIALGGQAQVTGTFYLMCCSDPVCLWQPQKDAVVKERRLRFSPSYSLPLAGEEKGHSERSYLRMLTWTRSVNPLSNPTVWENSRFSLQPIQMLTLLRRRQDEVCWGERVEEQWRKMCTPFGLYSHS